MNTNTTANLTNSMATTSAHALENPKVNVKLKLSALWIAVMFLYVYVDIFGFYKPGTIENILAGKVFTFDITPTWALSALVLMTIPSLMIVLSLILSPRLNRWVNMVVAVLYIAVSAGNAIGESWSYYFVGAGVEVVLLILVVYYAWTWPRTNSPQS